MMHDYGWGMGHWEGMPWGGWIGMLIFTVFLVLGIIFLVRCLSGRGRPWRPCAPGGETPLDILKKRYARGEISKEDFDRMRKELSE